MFDRLLYFLFRRKAGILILLVGVFCGAFALSGCFSWSVLSCACGQMGCDVCEDQFSQCDKQFSCNSDCDFFNCIWGNGCTKDCGDCGIITCGGCNSTCFTDCGAGCSDNSCQFSNCTCTDNGPTLSTYNFTVEFILYDANGDFIQTVSQVYTYQVEDLKDLPDSQEVSFPQEIAQYFGEVIRVLDGRDQEVGFENNTITVSFKDWKNKDVSYIPEYTVSFKVFAPEKRAGESVSIHIDYSDAGVSDEFYTVTVGQPMPNIAAKEVSGYNFVNFTKEDGTVIVFEEGDIFHLLNFRIDPSSDQLAVNIKANYDADTCKVTVEQVYNGEVKAKVYDSELDYGLTLTQLYQEIHGESFEIDPGETTKFIGWFYDLALTQPIDWSRDSLAGDTTIYCAYKTQVTVTLYNYEAPNNGNRLISAWWGDVLGTDILLPDSLPANGRFTFVGWFIDKNCLQSVAAGAKITGDTDLYAKWDEKTKYTVTYYADMGGTVTNITDTYDYYEGLKLLGQEAVATPNNYTFEGWRIKEDDGSFSLPTRNLQGQTYERNIEVYAAFSRNMQLSVQNGSLPGVAPSYSVKLYYKESASLAVPHSNDDSKVFAGWSTDSSGENMISGDKGFITSFEYTGNSPFLVAIWKGKTYTVTFFYYDGMRRIIVDEQEVEHGGFATAPAESPEKAGYTFAGWVKKYTDIPFSEQTPVTEDIEYQAKFESVEYTITLIVAGQEEKQIKVKYGTKPSLEIPESEDIFAGWYTQPGGNGERMTDERGSWVDDFYDIADDLTLYAYFI